LLQPARLPIKETMLGIHALYLLAFLNIVPNYAVDIKLDTPHPSNDPRVLNVHIVPHTHDDVGWLKTIDQYYYGSNNTIQHAAVRFILDTTIMALEQNPERKFTYVEMAFFSKWWEEQTDVKRQSVKKLVEEGRLSFANGGWCMHDEATTHFMGMIDQTTLGHQFLMDTFNYVPRSGWQIDPFGHSATQASLLSATAGFDALYFGRIDHEDLLLRQKSQRCEGIWSASKSLDSKDTEVFFSLTGSYGGNYGPPEGFCFDNLCGAAADPLVEGFNIDQRVSDFVDVISLQANRTLGHNVMATMGEDFNYENAFVYFRNLDKLIEYVNQYQAEGKIDKQKLAKFDAINLFYSTPDIYTDAKHAEKIQFEVKDDDFFPYSDCENCFWSGYFTSRPNLKRFERVASSFLHAATQLHAVGDDTTDVSESVMNSPLFPLQSAVAEAQHHDGVTGTSKQHVAYDYAKRIDEGMEIVSNYVGGILGKLLGLNDEGLAGGLKICRVINETTCEISQNATIKPGTDIYVVAYNALSIQREEIIKIPVSQDATYRVHVIGNDTDLLESVLVPASPQENSVQDSARYILYFDSGFIPPLGAIVFCIEMIDMVPSALSPISDIGSLRSFGSNNTGSRTSLRRTVSNHVVGSELVVENGIVEVRIHRTTGLLSSISNGEKQVDFSQQWGYYTSYNSEFETTETENVLDCQFSGRNFVENSQKVCLPGYIASEEDDLLRTKDSGTKQNSGAYIFRPKTPDEKLNLLPPSDSFFVYESELVMEIHVQFSNWVTQITRVYAFRDDVEVEFIAGPIPDDDGNGRELVTRFTSSISNEKKFYTDSNGREFVERQVGYRPSWNLSEETQPIAGNYYPVNTAIFIEDDFASLALLTDRSQGGSSLSNGSIELMVHRRTKADDSRGVGEALDETDEGMTPYPPYGKNQRKGKGVVVRGSHRIIVGRGNEGASCARKAMDEIFSPVHLFFASAPSSLSFDIFARNSFSLIKASLPKNVMLITFAKLDADKFLIRLGHQYALNEDINLSQNVDVDLALLFPKNQIVFFVEKTLTGNQSKQNWKSKKLNWSSLHGHDIKNSRALTAITSAGNTISLKPMEIRTFEIELQNNSSAPKSNGYNYSPYWWILGIISIISIIFFSAGLCKRKDRFQLLLSEEKDDNNNGNDVRLLS